MKGSIPENINRARFRIAPTPSGFLHLGNACNFILTYVLARSEGAGILLRIDDLDSERFRDDYLDDIFRSIDWLKIEYDEGPSGPDDFKKRWSQFNRRHLYLQALLHLMREPFIYSCECSRIKIQKVEKCNCMFEPMQSDENNRSWRYKTVFTDAIAFEDMLKGETKVYLDREISQFIVRKKDGDAAYQVSSLIDDMHFKVTHIIRGEDLIPSTAAQIALSRILPENNFERTVFLHHPLLLDESGEKLSKSKGSLSLKYFRQSKSDSREIMRTVAKWLRIEYPVFSLDELLDAAKKTSFDNKS